MSVKTQSMTIEPEDITGGWPFAPRRVVLCELKGAVWVEHGGMRYALNGLANQLFKDEDDWVGKIDDIWLDDPGIPGLKMDIGRVIDAGLSLK